MSEPWTVKHRPKTTGEVVGNKLAIEKLIQWLESWSKGKPGKGAALLYGPPGVGKTVVTEAVSRDRGWDLVEINASDKRSGEVLSRIAGLASTQGTLGGKGRLILLDEVDGINLREDQGAIKAIQQVVKDAKFPIVLTANDPWDTKVRPLRDDCLLIELKRLGVREGLPLLRGVLSKEGVKAEDEALRALLDKNSGDIRSTLNDLQILSGTRKSVSLDEVEWLSRRDRTESIFEALRIVFNSKTVAAARRATNISDVDHEMLFQWIFENAPYQIPDPHELSNAMSAMAEADLVYARIRKTQQWHLLSYALDLMTAGVAVAKNIPLKGFVPMRFPQRIASMARTRGARELRKNIGRAIASRCHISSRRATQVYLPLIQIMSEHNPAKLNEVGQWLDAKEELYQFFSEN
jgi:replication factor C large subunit